MGFERDEVPSRVQGSALPGQGQRPCVPRAKPPKPTRAFRRRRKSSAKPPKKREKPQVAIPDKGKVTCGFLACVTRLLFRSAAMQGIDSLEKVDWEENDEGSTLDPVGALPLSKLFLPLPGLSLNLDDLFSALLRRLPS